MNSMNSNEEIASTTEEEFKGKIPIKFTNDVGTEALARITSAIRKQNRQIKKTKKLSQEKDLTLKMSNGKFYEIPNLLDGFRMLNWAPADDPDMVYSLDISGQELMYVLEDDLLLFTKLETLKAGENQLPFVKLGLLPALKKLFFACNDVTFVDLEIQGKFLHLQTLDLSFNTLNDSALIALATLPQLLHLDLTHNSITHFPETIKDMENWKEAIHEILFPTVLSGSKDPCLAVSLGRETPKDLLDKRSFSKLMTPKSVASTRQESPQILGVGFPYLQTLVLERNQLDDQIFDVLSHLSNLKILNLNFNCITSCHMFLNDLPPNVALEQDPHERTFFDGFLNLKEIHLKGNQIQTFDDLVGLLFLQRLRSISLDGNPVIYKYPLHKGGESTPFQLFPQVYGIDILDLKFDALKPFLKEPIVHSSMNAQKSTPYKEKRHHTIGQLLHKNFPASVKGNRHEAPHKVDEFLDLNAQQIDQERRLRMHYLLTDDDIENIIRMGHIPKLKELLQFDELKEKIYASKDSKDKIIKGMAKEVLFDPDKRDETFLTSVHIQETNDEAVESSESSQDSEDETLEPFKVPNTLQAIIRELRHALVNPTSFWRISDESYQKPTKSFLSRQKSREKSDKVVGVNWSGSIQDNGEQPEASNVAMKPLKTPTMPTPANTIFTPTTNARIVEANELQPTIKSNYKTPTEFVDIVTRKLTDDPDSKIGTLAYQPRKSHQFIKKKKQSVKIKSSNELTDMKDTMDDIDRKLLLIETDLASILGNSELRKKLPQSQKLLDELRKEYERIEREFMSDAKRAVQMNELDETDSNMDMDEVDDASNFLYE